jgi:hypothetical protein
MNTFATKKNNERKSSEDQVIYQNSMNKFFKFHHPFEAAF